MLQHLSLEKNVAAWRVAPLQELQAEINQHLTIVRKIKRLEQADVQ